jgi:hypothetical protein
MEEAISTVNNLQKKLLLDSRSLSFLYTHLYILGLIYEEDPVEMIDLVLDDASRQSLEAHGVFFTFWVKECHFDPTPSDDITTLAWN